MIVSGTGDLLLDDEQDDASVTTTTTTTTTGPGSVFDIHSILKNLKCQGAGISVSVYGGFNGNNHGNTKECTYMSVCAKLAYIIIIIIDNLSLFILKKVYFSFLPYIYSY